MRFSILSLWNPRGLDDLKCDIVYSLESRERDARGERRLSRGQEMTFQQSFAVRPQSRRRRRQRLARSVALRADGDGATGRPREIDVKNSARSADNRTSAVPRDDRERERERATRIPPLAGRSLVVFFDRSRLFSSHSRGLRAGVAYPASSRDVRCRVYILLRDLIRSSIFMHLHYAFFISIQADVLKLGYRLIICLIYKCKVYVMHIFTILSLQNSTKLFLMTILWQCI